MFPSDAHSSHLLDVTIRRRWPRPLAQAWGRVLVAVDPFERQERLLGFTWLMLRVLGSYALADYVRDEPGKPSRKGSNPENLLIKLTRPTDGDWQSIVFHPMKAIAAHRAPFVPEFWAWLKQQDEDGETSERRLNQLVQARNAIRHGAASPNNSEASLAVEKYEATLRRVLGSMDWMTGYRLVRVSRSENLSTPGAFKGSFQFFSGSDDAPERVDARWRGWFQKGQLYLLSGDATRALNLSPFITVRATSKNPMERVFVVHKVTKSGAVLALDDRTSEEVEFQPAVDDVALGFEKWLERRPLKRCVDDLADVEGKLSASLTPARLGGALVDGKYRVHEALGQGATGTVYRAHHAILGTDYALKIIHEGLADDPVLSERFRREARLMSQVESPHVLGARDVGALPDGRMYIATDLVGGGTVADLIEAAGRDSQLVARVVRDAAKGLMALHAAGAVHRDIKPENLLVRRNGTVVVADMGIARAEDDPKLTATLERVGSRAYMAPEVLQGAPASPVSDVYSLGIVAAELFTGTRPSMTSEVVGDDAFTKLVRAMLALSPDTRPGLPELISALGTFVGDRTRPPSGSSEAAETKPSIGQEAGSGAFVYDGIAQTKPTSSAAAAPAAYDAPDVPSTFGVHATHDPFEALGLGDPSDVDTAKRGARPVLRGVATATLLLAVAVAVIAVTRVLPPEREEAEGSDDRATAPARTDECGEASDCDLGERCRRHRCVADSDTALAQAEARYRSMAAAYSGAGTPSVYFSHYADPMEYWYDSNSIAPRSERLGGRESAVSDPARTYEILRLIPLESSAERVIFLEEGELFRDNGRQCSQHAKISVLEHGDDDWVISGEMSLSRWDSYPGDRSLVPRFYSNACGSVRDSETGLEWLVLESEADTVEEASTHIHAIQACCADRSDPTRMMAWKLPVAGEVATLFPDRVPPGTEHPILAALNGAAVWTSDGDDGLIVIADIAKGDSAGIDMSERRRGVAVLAVRRTRRDDR